MTAYPPTASTPARLTCAGDADAVTAAEWRHTLGRWLRDATQIPAEVRDDILLGVNEALANCVEHAYRAHRSIGTMKLQASHDPARQSLSVCIGDRGTWRRPSSTRPNDPGAPRGRGIVLMHNVADQCSINARPTGTTVCLDYVTRRRSSGAHRPEAHRRVSNAS